MFSALEIKLACNGMLPVEVYEKIYEVACASPSNYFVEVGTAHAAATICLAKALKDTNRQGKVFSFEKIVGGSREVYGSFSENLDIIKGNINTFQVSEYVDLVIGDVRECADRVPEDIEIGLIILDADGRIDRDFGFFYDRLRVGGTIFIDDVDNRVRLKKSGRRGLQTVYKVDQKHRISYELLNVFKQSGLVDDGCFYGRQTWRGRKLDKSMSDLEVEGVLEAYRSLVFANAEIGIIPLRKQLAGLAKRLLPESVVERLRRHRRSKPIP